MTTVIKGGTLIDGTGNEPLPKSAVVIEGDSIVAVGAESKTNVPRGAQVIDATGKTVLPGFIDVHAHMIAYEYDLEKRLTTPASLTIFKTIKNLKATLEAGVTTVRDAGGADVGVKTAVAQGLVPGPRLFVCLYPLTQTGGLFDLYMGSGAKLDMTNMTGRVRHFVSGIENLRQAVREFLLAGADVLKMCTTGSVYRKKPGTRPAAQFTLEEIQTVVYEAHVAGKRTMTHAEGGPGLHNAIVGGIDSIEHGFFLTDEDIALMLERGTFLVPTMACNYGILKVSERDPKSGINEQSIQVAKGLIADHAKSFHRAAQAGVKIAMGSDAFGWDQGENLFELELMVRNGFSPMQAILAGTKRAAECLGIENQLGTLEKDKIADVLVVDGNPLDDIKVLQAKEKLLLIMKEGQAFKNLLS